MSRSSRAVGAAFSPLVMIVLAVVVVASLAGLAVLSAYAPELEDGNDGGAHALSNSAVGYRGAVKLLRATGTPVSLSRGRRPANAFDSLTVATPPPGANAGRVERQAGNGGGRNSVGQVIEPALLGLAPVLVVLPKWTTVAESRRPGWVTTLGPWPEEAALAVLPAGVRAGLDLERRAAPATVQLARPSGQPVGRPVRIETLQTLSGGAVARGEWIPVVKDPSGAVVMAMKRGSRLYVLTEPDLLNTHGVKTLAGAETAVAVLGLARAADAPVAFDLTLHGFQRTRSLLRLMLEPPLLGVTLLMATLAVFAGFHATVRFGPARETGRTVALGKRALADNTAGLVRLAGREHRMAGPYALLVRAAVARAIGVPRALGDVELEGFLDRVGAASGASARYSALAASAAAAKTPDDLMSVARDLHRWKQEMTRGRQ